MIVLGFGFFALAEDRRFVTIGASLVIAGYIVLASLTLLSIVPQHSMVVAQGP